MKNILVVDDSALMRRTISDIINSDEEFEDEEEYAIYAINEATWDLYYEFNESEYEDLQQQAWEFNCDFYDYDIITDIIYRTISELEELA